MSHTADFEYCLRTGFSLQEMDSWRERLSRESKEKKKKLSKKEKRELKEFSKHDGWC